MPFWGNILPLSGIGEWSFRALFAGNKNKTKRIAVYGKLQIFADYNLITNQIQV